MSQNPAADAAQVATGSDAAFAYRAADWLRLAAAPVFALMALLTAGAGGSLVALCSAASRDASPLSSMALMYTLMSAVHAAPWLRLIARR